MKHKKTKILFPGTTFIFAEKTKKQKMAFSDSYWCALLRKYPCS